MSESCWSTSIERDIPSDAAVGKELIDELLVQLEQNDWSENDIFGMHLAVEEALVNAIKHGNQNDVSKKVNVVYKLSPTQLHIQITDEGDGFDPNDVPDPTDEENLEIPSGRGLMLMHSFMTTVKFNSKGNQVVMEKKRV